MVSDGGNTSRDGATDSGGSDPRFQDSGAPDAADGCPEAAKLIYVTGGTRDLWSFKPPSTFKLIGTMKCDANYIPTHMTVDRQATAWAVFNARLYKVSTVDASCVQVPNWKQDPQNYGDFALSFAGNTNSPDTSLFILPATGKLGRFDTSAGSVSVIGTVEPSLQPANGDMTSNGDGTLYFLKQSYPRGLSNLSPSSAATLKSYSIVADAGGGNQALAFWGGSFYLFFGSSVWQFDPKQNTTTYVGVAPLSVTGAGQSTCAPQVPPPPG